MVNQMVVLVTMAVGLIVSPALWGGVLGSAFGIAFGKRVKFWYTGVLWLLFGIVVAVISNKYAVKMVNDIDPALAAFAVAFGIAFFKERIFGWFKQWIYRVTGAKDAA